MRTFWRTVCASPPIHDARRRFVMLAGWRLFVAALIRQWKWKPRFRCASKASKPSRVRADLLPSLARPPISGFNRCLWCVCGISIGRQAVDFERGNGSRESQAPFCSHLLPPPLSLFGTPYLEMQEMGERDGGFTSAHSARPSVRLENGSVESRLCEKEIEEGAQKRGPRRRRGRRRVGLASSMSLMRPFGSR